MQSDGNDWKLLTEFKCFSLVVSSAGIPILTYYTFHQNPMIEQGSLIYFSILDSQNLCKERRDLQPSGYDFEQD